MDKSISFDAFISYSHKDADWVRGWLLPRLERSGLRIAIDFRDFEIGVPNIINMERAIERSRRTLLILTDNWLDSEWTKFESLLVQTDDPSGLERGLLPILLHQCQLPKRLAIFNYANFTREEDWETEMERIFNAVSKTRNESPGLGDEEYITERFGKAWNRLAAKRPANGFHLITVSGPSAVGKDALIHVVQRNLGDRFTLLTKYTTRASRLGEEAYSVPSSDEHFDLGLEKGDLIFPYYRRSDRYAFDTRELTEAIDRGRCMCAVFTDFNLVPIATKALREKGMPTTPFLIEAARDDLERRTLQRGFDDSEIVERMRSIDQDLHALDHGAGTHIDYVRVPNGDDRAFSESADDLTSRITAILEGVS